MAARENQGLQIALIVFVVLTLALSVTTFLFLRNYQNEQIKSKEADAKSAKATQQAADAQAERDSFLQYIGFPASEKKANIDSTWESDMKANQPLIADNLPADQKTYRKLVAGLQGVVNAQHAQNEKLAADLRDAKATYDRLTAEYQTEKAKLIADMNEKAQSYLTERDRIAKELKLVNDSKVEMVSQLQDKDAKTATEKAGFQGQIASLQKNLDQTQTQLKLKADTVNSLSGEFSVHSQPDGKILWVNQRDNLVYINLGSADRLRKRITFTVFDPSTTDVTAVKSKNDDGSNTTTNTQTVSDAKKKGVIEVVSITQPHVAACRVLDSISDHPLLPNDIIFTPLWRPGQQDHFALVGTFDIDGDGVNDRAKVHDIIRVNGGIVDAETDDKGNVQGTVTPSTRYLVRGNTDAHEGMNPEAGNKLMLAADKLGVEIVSMAKFLDMMGYTPTAKDMNIDAAAKAPTAGEPNANFRPRSPGSHASANSSY